MELDPGGASLAIDKQQAGNCADQPALVESYRAELVIQAIREVFIAAKNCGEDHGCDLNSIAIAACLDIPLFSCTSVFL